MLSRLLPVLSLALLVTACGGAPPATPTTPTGAEAGEHHHDDSGQPAPVRAFHDTLAPLWHADKGPDRIAKTCAQAKTLQTKAEATNDKELIAATVALVAECAKDGRADFEAKFGVVHERFHAVAKHAEH